MLVHSWHCHVNSVLGADTPPLEFTLSTHALLSSDLGIGTCRCVEIKMSVASIRTHSASAPPPTVHRISQDLPNNDNTFAVLEAFPPDCLVCFKALISSSSLG